MSRKISPHFIILLLAGVFLLVLSLIRVISRSSPWEKGLGIGGLAVSVVIFLVLARNIRDL
jgi:divalent metal cation (Fe/Co/Zn/Cd) transporter